MNDTRLIDVSFRPVILIMEMIQQLWLDRFAAKTDGRLLRESQLIQILISGYVVS